MALEQVEQQTKQYADSRSVLVERVRALNEKIDGLKRTYLRGIKSALSETKEQRGLLEVCIEENRDAFEKPRTHVFHGIKVGYKKGKGKLSFANAQRTLDLIRKHLPELEEALIRTEEKPDKHAIANLDGQQMKAIGASISGAGDQVVIATTDSDIDKLVEAMMADDADGDDTD